MTMGKQKLLCEENLRHAEYYGMLGTFDSLYAQSKEGREFIDLMSLMLKRENILLAYRNIKANTGSKTAGTDKLTIGDIGKLSPDEVVQKVRYIVQGTEHATAPNLLDVRIYQNHMIQQKQGRWASRASGID